MLIIIQYPTVMDTWNLRSYRLVTNHGPFLMHDARCTIYHPLSTITRVIPYSIHSIVINPSSSVVMSIGPSLPPHLQSKPHQHDNDDDDDDAYGPSLPPTVTAGPARPHPAGPSIASSTIGPTLPPHLQQPPSTIDRPQDGDDDDDDDFSVGPALPPHLLAARSAASSSASTRQPLGPARPPVGPTLPPSHYSAPDPDSDSDDSDIVGPLPSEVDASSDASSAVRDFQEREARWKREREEAAKPKVVKREEWMLKPPEAGDVLSSEYTSVEGCEKPYSRGGKEEDNQLLCLTDDVQPTS